MEKKEKRPQINYLSLHPKKPEKGEKIKCKVRQKKIIKSEQKSPKQDTEKQSTSMKPNTSSLRRPTKVIHL